MDLVIFLLLAVIPGFLIFRGVEGIVKNENNFFLNLAWIGLGYWIFYTFLNFMDIFQKYDQLIFTNVPFAYLSTLSLYLSKKQKFVSQDLFSKIVRRNLLLPVILFFFVIPVYFYPRELKLLLYECSIHLESLSKLLQFETDFKYIFIAQVLIEYGAKLFSIIYILKFIFIKTNEALNVRLYIAALFILFGGVIAFMGGIISNIGFHIGGILAFLGILYYRYSPESWDKAINEILTRKYSHTKKLPLDQIESKIEQKFKEEKVYRSSSLSLPKLARSLGISTHQLSEFINEKYQMSFNSFVNQFRIEEARRLLAEATDLNVLEISLEVGFSSRSAFNSVFKNFTGMSPKDFRQKHMKSGKVVV